MIEIWGYISMIVVLISVLMKDIKKLRMINTISCIMFVIYGIALGAYPIVIMNSLVIVINIWRLYKGE
jgi:hypothetical protein